ncbi:MAG: OmpW family outer membrane protein [Pseudomonadota bacterium]
MTISPLMRKALTAACIFGLCGAIATTANADDNRGYYARATLGLAGIGTDELTLNESGVQTRADADFDAGFAGGGAFGYRYNENLRVELDLTYRSSEINEVTFANGGRQFTEGNFASLTFGVTGLYDFPNDSDWTPYVGAGLAWVQEVDIDFEDASGEISYETDDIGIAALAGVRWQSPSAPWFIDAEFRYINVGDVEMTRETGTATAEYNPWTVGISAGWQF